MWGLADLSHWLGNETGAARYRALHASGVAAYNRLLWDGQRGAFGDWIDTAGRRRFYLYRLRPLSLCSAPPLISQSSDTDTCSSAHE